MSFYCLDLKAQLRQYKLYHNEKTNVRIHMIFVPMILFSICCLTHRMPLGHGLNLADILTTAFSIYYVVLCFIPGIIASLLLFAVDWSLDEGKIQLSLCQELLLFAIGWAVQFIGHGYFERRRPALMDNLVQSLVTAPYFVLFELLFKLGFYQQLQNELEKDIQNQRQQQLP